MILLALLVITPPEAQVAQRVGALLRFVARIEEVEGRAAFAREETERRAAADAIERELQSDSARELKRAVNEGRVRDVAWLAARLERQLAAQVLPRRPPSLARGSKLYAQSCAACHGIDGRPTALELSTPAPSFVDPEPADSLSPRRIFDAVTAGVPESAMPAFDQAFSDEDRWAIAFYVQALRHADARGRAPDLSLGDAALASDALLRARLEAAGVTPSEIESSIASLRWHPPRRRGGSRLALVVPGWLAPVRLRSDTFDPEGGESIDLVLQKTAPRANLMLLVNLVARQAFLRASTPLTGLAVNVYETGAKDAIARCTLVAMTHVQCGVAPP